MAHSFRSHLFHLIWSTKNRKDLITDDIQPRLYAYLGGIVKHSDGVLLNIGGTANHVHLLLSISLLDKYTYLIRDLKTKSNHWINENFPHIQNFSWQEGYGSFSISYSSIDKVKEYIQNQKEHHKRFSFDDEFLQILKKHNIQCDQRFVLG